MSPTEGDLILRSIDLLRDETRLAMREMREDVTGKLTDHEKRLRDLEEQTARDAAVDGYRDTMRRSLLEGQRWRTGIALTLTGMFLTSLISLARLLGVL